MNAHLGQPHAEQARAAWGGARPGAGAPPGNRNAAKRTIEEVVRDDAHKLWTTEAFGTTLKILPPAMGELLSLALKRTIDRALAEARRATDGMSEAEVEFEARRAVTHAGQAVLAAFMDSWGALRRSREQREASAVRALRPWLEEAPALSVKPDQSSQSSRESGRRPSIKNNQVEAPVAPRTNTQPEERPRRVARASVRT